MRRYLPKSREELLHWYERYVSPLALIAGFLADNLIFLQRVDLWTSNLLFLFYLLVSITGIALLNLTLTGRLQNPLLVKIAPFLPVVVQFAFGGLFSAYLTLYIRSAGLISSWIFILVLAALLIGNERFMKYYSEFTFQISIYFTVLFSFLIFSVPIVVGQIGPVFFLLSGFLALGGMALVIKAFGILMPELVREHRTKIIKRIASIFIIFNALYFVNAIPPLPLALKDTGVYHGVEREGDTYMLEVEKSPWYERYIPGPSTFHRAPGESVFVFSAVFAPTRLSTTIFHEWERYDEKSEKWTRAGTFGFPISGGRDGGYRGYSLRENVQAGKWRVNVRTGSGLLIGRILFNVENVEKPVKTLIREA